MPELINNCHRFKKVRIRGGSKTLAAKSSQQGSALISALFMMTLIAIAATAMSVRLQLDIHHTRITLQSEERYRAANLVNFWAISVLNNSGNIFLKTLADGSVQHYPQSIQPYQPQLSLSGQIIDLQGRFNLNNIIEKKYYGRFLELIKNAAPQSTKAQQELIAQSTLQWILPYQPGRGEDRFLKPYLQQKPGYYPAHQAMMSVSEFRLVNGVDAQTYQQLLPYITVLPESTAINVNTASEKVLATLAPGLSTSQVHKIIEQRKDSGIKNISTISKLLQQLNIAPEDATLNSQYFLVIATVKDQENQLTTYTIFKRQRVSKGKFISHMLSQSFNTL